MTTVTAVAAAAAGAQVTENDKDGAGRGGCQWSTAPGLLRRRPALPQWPLSTDEKRIPKPAPCLLNDTQVDAIRRQPCEYSSIIYIFRPKLAVMLLEIATLYVMHLLLFLFL